MKNEIYEYLINYGFSKENLEINLTVICQVV